MTKQSNAALKAGDYLSQIHDSPGFFCREILNMPVVPDQDLIFDAVRNAKYMQPIAVASGHGPGKTAAMGGLGLWWLGTRENGLVITVAPKLEQLQQQLWTEMRIWMEGAIEPWRSDLIVGVTRAYRRHNDRAAEIIQWVAREEHGHAETMHVPHRSDLLILIDEASGVSDRFIIKLKGALTKKGNVMVLAGNPTRITGAFHKAFHEDADRYNAIHLNCMDSPLVSKEWITSMIDEYGEDSNHVRVMVKGLFPHEDDDSLIELEWVNAAIERNCEMTDDLRIGIDPGRSLKRDASGFCARAGNKILAVEEKRVRDEMAVVGYAIDLRNRMLDEHNVAFEGFFTDIIGVGAGVHDRLKEMGEPAIEVDVSMLPTIKKRQKGLPMPKRLRDQLWLLGRDYIRYQGDIPDHAGFKAELLAPKLLPPDSSGHFIVESKASMIKRGIKSPNLADAFIHTFYPKRQKLILQTREVAP